MPTSKSTNSMSAWAEAENAELPELEKRVAPPFAENDFSASPLADRAVVALSTRAID